jgi:hypothetical protein
VNCFDGFDARRIALVLVVDIGQRAGGETGKAENARNGEAENFLHGFLLFYDGQFQADQSLVEWFYEKYREVIGK